MRLEVNFQILRTVQSVGVQMTTHAATFELRLRQP